MQNLTYNMSRFAHLHSMAANPPLRTASGAESVRRRPSDVAKAAGNSPPCRPPDSGGVTPRSPENARIVRGTHENAEESGFVFGARSRTPTFMSDNYD